MRTKMALAVLAASTLAAGNMSAFGGVLKSESTPATSEVQTEEASATEDEAQTVSIETSEYYFGKINVPYADFYYGEINHVQPEALEDAAAGQYDAEDKVTAAGLREEGIYSLAGGILCWFVMSLISALLKKKFIVLISMCGAAAHNIGQILAAIVITHSISVVAYLPVLMLSAMITGCFTGLAAQVSAKRLQKILRVRFF